MRQWRIGAFRLKRAKFACAPDVCAECAKLRQKCEVRAPGAHKRNRECAKMRQRRIHYECAFGASADGRMSNAPKARVVWLVSEASERTSEATLTMAGAFAALKK